MTDYPKYIRKKRFTLQDRFPTTDLKRVRLAISIIITLVLVIMFAYISRMFVKYINKET